MEMEKNQQSEPLKNNDQHNQHHQPPSPLPLRPHPPPLLKKESLKKQLSFDEKVTEICLKKNSQEWDTMLGEGKLKSVRWWDPSEKNTFAHFCKTTSIHGLQYLGQEGVHIGERILWAIIFLVSAIASIWLIKEIFIKYRDSPVVVTFDSSEMFVGDLPFPAVTICNMNRVLKSKANEYMRLANSSDDEKEKVKIARQDVYYLDHVCSVSNKPFSKMFNYSRMRGTVNPDLLSKINLKKGERDIGDVKKFLQKASQPCSEMIKLCMWEGDPVDCKEIFRPIETSFGKCCVFNMVPFSLLHKHTVDSRETESLIKKWKHWATQIGDKFGEHKSKFPKRQRRAGKGSGLMFLADPALDEYYCTNSDSTGFRLSVHYTTDIPHVTDFGLAIRPNHEHFISLSPDVIIADDVIKSYSIEKRKCYFEEDYTLKYYNLYTTSNCLDECVAEKTFQQCGCVRYYMPRDDSRDICSPANFSCAENVKSNVMKSGLKSMCQECLPTCTDVKYSASSTTAPLQRVDLWVDDTTNKTAPWAKKNVSIVYVYFGEDSTYPKLRGQLYGITDLISQTGGLLGLCMGFSLLSLFEVIFHFTFRPWCRKEQMRVQRLKHPPTPESPPEAKGHGLANIGFHHEKAEARRIHMKPGDDGLYHLENKSASSPPLRIGPLGIITDNEKTKDPRDSPRPPPIEEDEEDSHL